MKYPIYTVLFFLLIFFSGCRHKSDMLVCDLRCENLKDPVGIDKTTPRFSWKVKSDVNGTRQTAFHILVASDPSLLREGKADLWDSGKIASSAGILVPYQGKELSSGTAAFWKVRVYNQNDEASPWSREGSFVTGLTEESDWQGSYIGYNIDAGYTECPQLYKSFEIDDQKARYFLHVNSLGYHEVYINGEKVGNGVLTPAVSQFGERSLVNTYDLTGLLEKGKNDLMLWLGSGWYTEGLFDVVSTGPLVRAQLEKVSSNNGRETVLVTDRSWSGRLSSYSRTGSWKPHHFGGEVVDGRLAKSDLSVESTGGRRWEPAEEVTVPAHKVTPQMVELNEITDTISPVAIVQIAQDTFIIDMGRNLTGWFEMNFDPLEESQEIIIEYFDNLDDYRSFSPSDKYIAAGEGPEVFRNKFNYYGYRYLRILNLPGMPDLDSIRGYLIHTGYETASGFECSDSDLNKIHDMFVYTLRCLSLGGVLVDCPHIERLGYGGDGNASTVTAQTMFDLAPMYTNWFQAWADVIREDGSMPHTAPNVNHAGGGPYWCGFIITASWYSFINYGDTLMLKTNYPVMQKWLEYVDKYTVDGLLKRWPDTPYRAWYLGDWASPEGVDHTAEASVDLVNNSFMVLCYNYLQKIARVLGKADDIELYASREKKLKEIVHNTFYDDVNNIYGTGIQIDLAFPLLAEIVPRDLIEVVVESLERETYEKHGGHIACGLVGLPVLTEWAVKNRAYELIYTMLIRRGYPGYLYMIDKGATTTWEHWNGHRSRIHNCYNGIGQWFYQAIGGIRPVDGFAAYRKVIIDPQIPDGIRWANTFKETPFGRLAVNWEINEGNMNMDIEIPVGVEASVIIPDKVRSCVFNGSDFLLDDQGTSAIELISGKHKLEYKMQ
jgi:alpha-L-rhamnosidase